MKNLICDVCNKPIKKSVPAKPIVLVDELGEDRFLSIKITVGFGRRSAYGKGEVCAACVKAAILTQLP